MAYAIGATQTNVQARDLRTILRTQLAAEGWTQRAAAIVSGSFEWDVWTNNYNGSDFGIAYGIAATGTGQMLFRIFEDWLNDGNKVRYFAPTPSINFSPPDAFGVSLHSASGTKYPIPASQASAGWRPAAGGDYGVGVFGASGVSNPPATEQAILDTFPHAVDIRSAYVAELTLQADDPTAVEYIISTTPGRVIIATRRVFNNTLDDLYVGSYESLTPFDQGRVVMGSMKNTNWRCTRDWTFDGLPMPRTLQPTNGGQFVVQSPGPFGFITGNIHYDYSQATWSTHEDVLWYAPRGTRRMIARDTSQGARGLLYSLYSMPGVITGGIPPIGFGDTLTINGVNTTLYDWSTSRSLWVPNGS